MIWSQWAPQPQAESELGLVFGHSCLSLDSTFVNQTRFVVWAIPTPPWPRSSPATLAAAAQAGLAEAFPGKLIPANDLDWEEEYLDLILAVKTVSDLDDAVAFINTHGSAHSDAIVTKDQPAAERFLREVDSAAVYWNASTRFTDGGEFGLGAEIGISTDRLHALGPMDLRELFTIKWVARGTGQVR